MYSHLLHGRGGEGGVTNHVTAGVDLGVGRLVEIVHLPRRRQRKNLICHKSNLGGGAGACTHLLLELVI